MSTIKNPILLEGKPLNYMGGVFCLPETESGAGYCTEYQVVYDAFNSKPEESVANAQNTMVQTLVDASLWGGRLDLFYVLANDASDNALINWLNPGTNNLTRVGSSLPFVAYEGFTGKADSASWLNSGWNPKTAGGHFELNNCHLGTYQRINQEENFVGCANLEGNLMAALLPKISNGFYIRMNDEDMQSTVCTNGVGLFIGGRPNSSSNKMWSINGSYVTASRANTIAIANDQMKFATGSNQYSFGFAGGYLNAIDVSILYYSIKTYMDSNGK